LDDFPGASITLNPALIKKRAKNYPSAELLKHYAMMTYGREEV
jgi:hypothetical protein